MNTNALWTALLRAGYDLVVTGRVEHDYLRGRAYVMERGHATDGIANKHCVGTFDFSGDRVSTLSGQAVQRVATALMTAATAAS